MKALLLLACLALTGCVSTANDATGEVTAWVGVPGVGIPIIPLYTEDAAPPDSILEVPPWEDVGSGWYASSEAEQVAMVDQWNVDHGWDPDEHPARTAGGLPWWVTLILIPVFRAGQTMLTRSGRANYKLMLDRAQPAAARGWALLHNTWATSSPPEAVAKQPLPAVEKIAEVAETKIAEAAKADAQEAAAVPVTVVEKDPA